ncbi:hypothetical protein GRF29_19g2484756 [Pseudopithomyces chartarum]|uniref:Uncharacterized protein n=1 Tax=Pseudopithomyces chartarum TaxID=1892770 RepID=A0AAN6M3P5_9PLEO|nr:hypothetical protein GRF29_19g2484756 [Pseudopithomyces chartarum]
MLGFLAVVGTDALVPQTVSVPVYTTTSVNYVQDRQVPATPVPNAGASVPLSATFKSTTIITSTLSPTTILDVTVGTNIGGSTASSVTSYSTTWSTLTEITSISNSLSWSTCNVPETCTFANGTKDSNGKLIIPIPIPILVIIQQLVPVAKNPRPILEPPDEQEIGLDLKVVAFIIGIFYWIDNEDLFFFYFFWLDDDDIFFFHLLWLDNDNLFF